MSPPHFVLGTAAEGRSYDVTSQFIFIFGVQDEKSTPVLCTRAREPSPSTQMIGFLENVGRTQTRLRHRPGLIPFLVLAID